MEFHDIILLSIGAISGILIMSIMIIGRRE